MNLFGRNFKGQCQSLGLRFVSKYADFFGQAEKLSDVAGIDWLMSKFKAYVILRDRLLTDTSILRDKLDVAVPDFGGGESTCENDIAKMDSQIILQV